ncbi:MAG: hypothetical protein EOQ47_21785 [Mesorhizobium sp.]|nr:MAG: hypothetical protein EOQ47_21785 [Mesorhizobium sp.]
MTEGAMGKYYPLNLPHLLFTDFHRRLSAVLAYFTVLIAFAVACILVALNVALMLSLWQQSSIGIYSKITVIYVAVCGAYSLLFMFLTRLPTSFTDYSLLQQIQIAEQLNPKHASEIRNKAYRVSTEDRIDLERRGFIKPRSTNQKK